MNLIVTEIANIIKSESNYIKRERKIVCFFLNLIKEVMSLALAEVDDEMTEELKAQGYQIERTLNQYGFWRSKIQQKKIRLPRQEAPISIG